jgi:hypothetical protein
MVEAEDGKWFRGQGKWAALKEDQIKQIAEYMTLQVKMKP